MPISTQVSWGNIKSKPTTLAGFGITGVAPIDQTGSRALNTNYTNSSGKWRIVEVSCSVGNGAGGNGWVSGIPIGSFANGNGGNVFEMVTLTVAPGAIYSVGSSGATTLVRWTETDIG